MTTVDHTLVSDPAEVGIVPQRLERLLTRINREIDEGVLPSCQLALAKDGKLVVFTTLGDATNETSYVIYSATKPIVAMSLLLLVQEGAVGLDVPVGELIPEFATNGKEAITLEQTMLHEGGFPRAPLGPPAWFDREGRLATFGKWKLNWEPGTKYEYHPTSAHWVLAEVIERISGIDPRKFVADRVTGPLGLPRLSLGLAEDQQHASARQELRGEENTPDELEAAIGVRALPVTEVTDAALMNFNDPATRALGVPGGGGVSTAADLALFYQHMLHDPTGTWKPDVLADATGNVRNRLPDLMGTPAERTVAFHTAGDDGKSYMRGMGRTVSPRAFGHNGAAGQLAWADPGTGLSLTYLTNGIDRNYLRQNRRNTAINSLAADCTRPLD